MLKAQPERYDCLLKGKIEELPQNDFGMYALILVMSGFCSYKTEDIDKAKMYYDAFYALFTGHFKENPPDSSDRAMYIGAIKNYCKFLIDEEDADLVDERYGELFDWCIARMVEPPVEFETVYELMQLHQLGCEYSCFEDNTKAFAPILGRLLSEAAATTVSPQTVLSVVKYYAYFSACLNHNEKQHYFVELVSRLVNGQLTESKIGPEYVLDLLCECTIEFGLEAKLKVRSLLEKLIMRVVGEHTELFVLSTEYYIEKGLELANLILEEKLKDNGDE